MAAGAEEEEGVMVGLDDDAKRRREMYGDEFWYDPGLLRSVTNEYMALTTKYPAANLADVVNVLIVAASVDMIQHDKLMWPELLGRVSKLADIAWQELQYLKDKGD
jgi:hypothetical protein